MEKYSQQVITQMHTYRLNRGKIIPNSVGKVYMIDQGQIVAHMKQNLLNKQYLIYMNFSGQKIQCLLQYRPLIEQFSKYEFIVLSRKNYSVDIVTLVNKQWKIQCIRNPKIIQSQNFCQKIYVFKQTNSFCIIGRISGQFKIVHYKKKEGLFQNTFEMNMDRKYWFKINEKGVIGGIEHKGDTYPRFPNRNRIQQERQVLQYINFESQNFNFFEESIQEGLKEKLENFIQSQKIIQIVELVPDVYICTDQIKYWLYDTKNSDDLCMKSIKINRQQNLPLFSYNCDRIKILGSFAVLATHQLLPSIMNFINSNSNLYIDQSISIVQSIHCFGYDPKICMYPYTWEIIENQEQNQIQIEVTTQLNLKDVYMDMLLHINQDFDDDLLQDTIELIVD